MFLNYENQDSFLNKIMKNNNNNNNDLNDDKIKLMIDILTKKNKEMISQCSSIQIIDESKFKSFIFIIIFDHNLISFNVDQLVTRKEMTRLKALNIKLESMNFNHLKSMLLFCIRSETQKVLKNINVSFNHFRIVNISKNLQFMFFSISIDVNNINKLHIADRKCQDILNVLNDYIEILKS